MRAIVCTRYGPPEVLRLMDVEQPVPRDNELLIRIRATTAHVGDTKIRSLQPGLGPVRDFFFKPVMRLMLGLHHGVPGVEDQLVTLDLRLFQDAEVAYRASDFTQQSLLSTTVQIQRTSPVGQLAAQNHVPASRDATCLYATGLGSRNVQPCALTDGDFSPFFTGDATTCVVAAESDGWPECAADSFEELTVALDHAVDAPTLFLYEFGGSSTTGVTLSVSEDGITFAPISSDLISFSVHHIDQPVRFIRFRREIAAQAPAAGGMRWFLSEVGIFQ